LAYEVRFARPVAKELRRLDRGEAKRIVEAAEALAEDPRPSGVQKVRGTPYMRIRVGSYRVVYEVRDEDLVVLVVKVGHRREVYRGL
jgi:mRNA interferase RelE/StbE